MTGSTDNVTVGIIKAVIKAAARGDIHTMKVILSININIDIILSLIRIIFIIRTNMIFLH